MTATTGSGTTASWTALGTTATVAVTTPEVLPLVVESVTGTLAQVDLACSRFRPDSELLGLGLSAGRPVQVSPLLERALRAALRAARLTGGAVDPTGGASIRAAGYDRDLADLAGQPPAVAPPIAFAGWRFVRLDPDAHTVRVPRGVELDLGATAKGLAAEAAQEAATAVGRAAGVLVSLGGDLAVSGPAPDGGWVVRIADDHRAPLDAEGPCVRISGGGLATSSTTVRRWERAEGTANHLLDPSTGRSVEGPWRTATVAAASCLDANTASTAALVMGDDAPGWLEARGLPARLVSRDGKVRLVGAWPDDEADLHEGAA